MRLRSPIIEPRTPKRGVGTRFALAIGVGCIAWASFAWADERSDFEKARIAFVKKDYKEADARFAAILEPKTGSVKTPELVHDAQFFWGAVKLAQGDTAGAHGLWERVIRDTNGQYNPDPLTFRTEVLNDYNKLKENLHDTIQHQLEVQAAEDRAERERIRKERERLEARVKELEKLTAEETVAVQNSRLVAMLPFGIGQFQNHNNALGWFFLLTQGAAVLTTVALFIPYRYNVDQFNSVLNDPSPWPPDYRRNLANQYALVAQDLRTADLITLGVLGALVIGGIVEAQVDFKPSFETKRPRKKTGFVWPSFAPTVGGAQIGLQGRF